MLGSVAMFSSEARVFTDGELQLLAHQAQLASSVLALRRSSRTDTLGHAVGDRVLTGVARRFAGALRPSDTVARIGRDEFVAVCEGLQAPEDAELVADRLVASIENGLELDGTHIPVSVSIGIAVTGDRAVQVAPLLRSADQAMYRAKRQPGSSWVREPGVRPVGPDPRHVDDALRRSLVRTRATAARPR